jgi:hypothetical protein
MCYMNAQASSNVHNITSRRDPLWRGQTVTVLFIQLSSCNKYLFIKSGVVQEMCVMSDVPMIFLQIIYASHERCF